jgi:hypothetical protein
MTLIEALKTGKRIRRYGLFHPNPWYLPKDDSVSFSVKDVRDLVWEVEPDTKPRMLAYRDKKTKLLYMYEVGTILFPYSGEIPDLERMPFLDEPESKT